MPIPPSLTRHVVEVLRGKLLSGEYASGQRINEAEVAAELGISRGPVREAIQLLTTEGLLVHRRNHGASVPVLEADQITALFELRTALEAQAAELAAHRAGPHDLAELDRLCRLSNDSWHEGTRFPFELDLQFHTAVLKAADSPLLLEHGLLVHRRVIQLRAGITVPTSHTHSSMNDHEQITLSIRDRDALAARDLMASHLVMVAQQLQSALRPPALRSGRTRPVPEDPAPQEGPA